jgi:hypothetical protein
MQQTLNYWLRFFSAAKLYDQRAVERMGYSQGEWPPMFPLWI